MTENTLVMKVAPLVHRHESNGFHENADKQYDLSDNELRQDGGKDQAALQQILTYCIAE